LRANGRNLKGFSSNQFREFNGTMTLNVCQCINVIVCGIYI